MHRMMRRNYRLMPGRTPGHGSWCGDCKPNAPKGRAAEKHEWQKDQADDD